MAFLVNVPSRTPMTARDVARGTSIPEPYAAKVLRRMVQHGLLVGQKGHGGGFQLARPAEKIRYLDVLDAVEENLVTDMCAFGWEKCNSRKPCLLHNSVSMLKESAREWARNTTLASLRRGSDEIVASPLPTD